MKSLKALCAIGILSLFFSCSYQEDTAAFFIENQLNESLIVERVSNETLGNNIFHNVSLDLKSSESFERYLLRLTDIEITKFTCNFSDYQGIIENGQLFVDDLLLGNFVAGMDHVDIDDPQILRQIEELFIEKTALDFSFVGESNAHHFLSVNVQVEMKGTFVH